MVPTCHNQYILLMNFRPVWLQSTYTFTGTNYVNYNETRYIVSKEYFSCDVFSTTFLSVLLFFLPYFLFNSRFLLFAFTSLLCLLTALSSLVSSYRSSFSTSVPSFHSFVSLLVDFCYFLSFNYIYFKNSYSLQFLTGLCAVCVWLCVWVWVCVWVCVCVCVCGCGRGVWSVRLWAHCPHIFSMMYDVFQASNRNEVNPDPLTLLPWLCFLMSLSGRGLRGVWWFHSMTEAERKGGWGG